MPRDMIIDIDTSSLGQDAEDSSGEKLMEDVEIVKKFPDRTPRLIRRRQVKVITLLIMRSR